MIEIVDKYYKCEKCGKVFTSKKECKEHEEKCQLYTKIELDMSFNRGTFSLSVTSDKPYFSVDKYEIITEDRGFSVYTRNTEKCIKEGKKRLISYAEESYKECLKNLKTLKEELK